MEQDIRWQQRLRNFERACGALARACQYTQYSELERSGLIQTFEFTFELAWKTLQDLLAARGYIRVIGPRPVIEQAFASGILTQGEAWMNMMQSRNVLSHCYDEKVAEALAQLIKDEYFPLLTALLQNLKNEAGP